MKVNIQLEDSELKSLWDLEEFRSVWIDNKKFTSINGHNIFQDEEGLYWKLQYDSSSYEDYPWAGYLIGPVEPKVKEVIVYE